MFKPSQVDTYHHVSGTHLGRYVNEFGGRNNVRKMGDEAQVASVLGGTVGKRFSCGALIAA